MKKTVDLTQMFIQLQRQMIASLGVLDLDHGPTKGDYTELDWLTLFKSYLPKRYSADRAFVVDSFGLRSDAIDIVIFDNHFSPFLLHQNGVKFVPAESVYAVFEVKQVLNAQNITYAASKAASVRRLKRTSVSINNAGRVQAAKKHTNVVGGLLATRCGWAESGAKKALTKSLSRAKGNFRIDLGCCLEFGSFSIPPGQSNPKLSSKDMALMTFFFDLLNRLQFSGTVPALSIPAYMRHLK